MERKRPPPQTAILGTLSLHRNTYKPEGPIGARVARPYPAVHRAEPARTRPLRCHAPGQRHRVRDARSWRRPSIILQAGVRPSRGRRETAAGCPVVVSRCPAAGHGLSVMVSPAAQAIPFRFSPETVTRRNPLMSPGTLYKSACYGTFRTPDINDQASGQIKGYSRLSIIGSIPKKSLSTDSAVQYAPSTHAWSFE